MALLLRSVPCKGYLIVLYFNWEMGRIKVHVVIHPSTQELGLWS